MFDWFLNLFTKTEPVPLDKVPELQREHTQLNLKISSILDPQIEAASQLKIVDPAYAAEERRLAINAEQRERLEKAIKRTGNPNLYAGHGKRSSITHWVEDHTSKLFESREHSANDSLTVRTPDSSPQDDNQH